MSQIYLFSDPHFHHYKMAIKRGFKDNQEHTNHIITNWNKTITKRDVVWMLGDITMEKDNYHVLDELNGIKKVVLGNHDQPQHVLSLLKHVNYVCGMFKLKNFILTHAPIHECEIKRFHRNIHGHVHENTIPDERYINVSAEAIDYTPISLESLIKNLKYNDKNT